MKIAVPVRNGFVNEHFGHSDTYSVFTVSEDNRILTTEEVKAFEGCGCKSGIADVLANKGVTLMLAGNIGAGAIHHLYYSGIDVVRGCTGNAEEVVNAYLEGKIEDNQQTCHQHEGCESHHDHGHHYDRSESDQSGT